MKSIVIIAVAAMVLLIGYGAFAIHEIIPSETLVPLPGADAKKLNEYIVRHNPYTSWYLWPEKGRLYKGTEPHGALLTTFINDIAASSLKGKRGMTDGSIIAKENYTADKKFISLSVMYKVKGYNPSGGDWFWAKYAPDGSVEASGRVQACIDCHSKMKENDFLFTGSVMK